MRNAKHIFLSPNRNDSIIVTVINIQLSLERTDTIKGTPFDHFYDYFEPNVVKHTGNLTKTNSDKSATRRMPYSFELAVTVKHGQGNYCSDTVAAMSCLSNLEHLGLQLLHNTVT